MVKKVTITSPINVGFSENIGKRIIAIAELNGWKIYAKHRDASTQLKSPVSEIEAEEEYCLFPKGYRLLSDWDRTYDEKEAGKVLALGKFSPTIFLEEPSIVKVCLPFQMVPTDIRVHEDTRIIFRYFKPEKTNSIYIAQTNFENETYPELSRVLHNEQKGKQGGRVGVSVWLPYGLFLSGLEEGLEIPDVN